MMVEYPIPRIILSKEEYDQLSEDVKRVLKNKLPVIHDDDMHTLFDSVENEMDFRLAKEIRNLIEFDMYSCVKVEIKV